VTPPRGIRYVSPPPGTGYGDAAEQYIAGLRARFPTTWTSSETDPARLARSVHGDICDLAVDYDTEVLHIPPWELHRFLDPTNGKVQIGMMAWETDTPPAEWRKLLDQLDLILVCSRFVSEALARTGTETPVEVLPHIARPIRPDPTGAFGTITEHDFVFYVIGDWYNRKAIPDCVRTFLDTFTADDDVALIIKTSAFDYGALAKVPNDPPQPWTPDLSSWWALANVIKNYRNVPKVFMYAGDAPNETMDQIHTRGDCYFSLSTGEGFGLCAFDAAAYGNPSIVTGWGGHLEYLGTDYPLLVDYDLVSTATSQFDAYGFPLSDDARWAQARTAHAGALLRHVYEHREEAAALGADLRARLANTFTSDAITSRFVSLIEEAHARKARRDGVEVLERSVAVAQDAHR
jgi:glycosyltransferase involved in cell wall biosynthesis